ncbi:hypothetical protein EW146_g4710 [Bondarzewia mesenterica]|uniref:Uncharacterized protein n=1 Tax=Bondarzewia mesenterica TaxID=1095465 RepID=A0A4S4LZF1_9AGAM|nr:hypothetical protein EW146_g4710 [Bondarzewia mesenterica]
MRGEFSRLLLKADTVYLDLSLLTIFNKNDDIVPEHLSHHYLLSSPSPSLPFQPIDTSYYMTPPVSLSPTLPLDSDQSLLDLSPRLHYTPLPSNFRLQQPSVTTQVIIRSTMAPSMPAHGDRTAPTFDTKQPQVTNDEEKKSHACRFLDVDTCKLWQSLAEYTDAAKTYEDFKSVIYKLYPGAEEDRKWSITDMDKLIRERSRIGILSIGDLDEYHCQFLNITTFLIAKKCLSVSEQSRAFAQGFHPKLWA